MRNIFLLIIYGWFDDLKISEGRSHWLFSCRIPSASYPVVRDESSAPNTTLISIQDVYTKLYKNLHHIYYIFPEKKMKWRKKTH